MYSNVGNYIVPAKESGLIGEIIRIENEFQIDASMNFTPPVNSLLNIDLDIFSSDMSYIPNDKKVLLIKNLLQKCSFVTIATSPYFIDPWEGLKYLHLVLEN
jgi:hypothetical protein